MRMSKVTQVVEMLRVAEASIKELENLHSFGTVVHSADFLQSLTSKHSDQVPEPAVNLKQSNPNGTDAPATGNQTDIQTVESVSKPEVAELSAHAELQTIAEKLNQVIQLQDDVLANLKSDLDVLAVENHYFEELNYRMKTENEYLLRKLESLEVEAKELKELILEMEEQETCNKHLHESQCTEAADDDKSRCETSTSNPKLNDSEIKCHSKALQTRLDRVHEDDEIRLSRLPRPRHQVFENTAVGETKRSAFIRAVLKLFRLYK